MSYPRFFAKRFLEGITIILSYSCKMTNHIAKNGYPLKIFWENKKENLPFFSDVNLKQMDESFYERLNGMIL